MEAEVWEVEGFSGDMSMNHERIFHVDKGGATIVTSGRSAGHHGSKMSDINKVGGKEYSERKEYSLFS